MIISLLTAAVGVLLSALFSVLPGLHIYNVAGLALLALAAPENVVPPQSIAMLFVGMITGYAVLNTIPTVFLSAPDESTLFMLRPGQKFLLQGRGYEAALLSGVGGLSGIAVLLLLTPFASSILTPFRAVLHPHLHWILWALIAYLLLSEWPKGSQRAPAGWRRCWDGWRNLVAGLLAFVLSGVLGLILLYRTPVPVDATSQNLLPAFVGLFAVPSILHNLVSRVELPEQRGIPDLGVTPALVLQGALSGAAGGLFAAFFPVVTAGIGGLLAAHATAQRDDRVFLVSQGASKVLYYVGALLLFFVPGLHLTRGGMAWILAPVWDPVEVLGPDVSPFYYRAAAAALVSGVLAFFLLLGMARLAARFVTRVDYRWINLGTLILLLLFVVGWTGWGGLLICAAAVGIGLIPVLWGARRSNCMGVLLLPLAINMVGLGSPVVRWLGLA